MPASKDVIPESLSTIAIDEIAREILAIERREQSAALRAIADVPRRAVDAIREEFAQLPDAIEAAAREGERRRRGGQTP